MPQMNKGGKWVFGWCLVGPDREIQIPPEASVEYEFQPGEQVVFLRGSRRSGGFSIGHAEKLTGQAECLLCRSIGRGELLLGGRITVPPKIGIRPGERLLAVRGSGHALLFLQCGPIYGGALKYGGEMDDFF